jgi:hypothetical protein
VQFDWIAIGVIVTANAVSVRMAGGPANADGSGA